MRKRLKRRNIMKWHGIFKEGRRTFPKSEFGNITYLGKHMFAAKGAVMLTQNVALSTTASWG